MSSNPVFHDAVVKELRTLVGADMAIRLHFVDSIPVNPRSGKYQEVICRIEAPDHARQGAASR